MLKRNNDIFCICVLCKTLENHVFEPFGFSIYYKRISCLTFIHKTWLSARKDNEWSYKETYAQYCYNVSMTPKGSSNTNSLHVLVWCQNIVFSECLDLFSILLPVVFFKSSRKFLSNSDYQKLLLGDKSQDLSDIFALKTLVKSQSSVWLVPCRTYSHGWAASDA